MLHMKFEIHGCSGVREYVILMDLNGRVDIHCGRKDGRNGLTNGKPDAYYAAY